MVSGTSGDYGKGMYGFIPEVFRPKKAITGSWDLFKRKAKAEEERHTHTKGSCKACMPDLLDDPRIVATVKLKTANEREFHNYRQISTSSFKSATQRFPSTKPPYRDGIGPGTYQGNKSASVQSKEATRVSSQFRVSDTRQRLSQILQVDESPAPHYSLYHDEMTWTQKGLYVSQLSRDKPPIGVGKPPERNTEERLDYAHLSFVKELDKQGSNGGSSFRSTSSRFPNTVRANGDYVRALPRWPLRESRWNYNQGGKWAFDSDCTRLANLVPHTDAPPPASYNPDDTVTGKRPKTTGVKFKQYAGRDSKIFWELNPTEQPDKKEEPAASPNTTATTMTRAKGGGVTRTPRRFTARPPTTPHTTRISGISRPSRGDRTGQSNSPRTGLACPEDDEEDRGERGGPSPRDGRPPIGKKERAKTAGTSSFRSGTARLRPTTKALDKVYDIPDNFGERGRRKSFHGAFGSTKPRDLFDGDAILDKNKLEKAGNESAEGITWQVARSQRELNNRLRARIREKQAREEKAEKENKLKRKQDVIAQVVLGKRSAHSKGKGGDVFQLRPIQLANDKDYELDTGLPDYDDLSEALLREIAIPTGKK